MKISISTFLLAMAVSLPYAHTYAQHDKSLWEPFLYHSSSEREKESKEITKLRISFQQFMQALCSSVNYNFNGVSSASTITIGSSEEESLQYLMEASQIIRKELREKLPQEWLLEEFKNYDPPYSTTTQGRILCLKKDLQLYKAQMAHTRH